MNALVPKVYPLLVEAVEVGVRCGYRRAFKHTEHPTEEVIFSALEDAILLEIFERFEIPEKTC